MTQSLALLLSIVVEAISAYALIGACGWGSPLRAGLAAALGTLTTHWGAWSSIIWLIETNEIDYAPAVAAVESAVVLVEAIGYRLIVPLPLSQALLASFIANGASTASGLVLYALNLA
jgi:hypothetical protein